MFVFREGASAETVRFDEKTEPSVTFFYDLAARVYRVAVTIIRSVPS